MLHEIITTEPVCAHLDENWPRMGHISIKNLNLSYPTRKAPILEGITAEISPREKIAIIGRTGAGKSSFLSAFLRLVEPYPSGCITIDSENLSLVSIKDLRTRISVIPQEPVIYAGSLRFNLDPYGILPDSDLLDALKLVRLGHLPGKLSRLEEGSMMDSTTSLTSLRIEDDLLDIEMNSDCLSTGEKQLLCLARAILRKTKLIFMDEATANIDAETAS